MGLPADNSMNSSRIWTAPAPATIVVCGNAGVGKTRLLHALAGRGEQILDLEGLARHRGSAFGGFRMPEQPSHAAFQAQLVRRWTAMDPARPVWMEDEGPFLGSVGLPPGLQHLIATSPTIELRAPLPVRLRNLLADYGQLDPSDLLAATRRIAPRLGRRRRAAMNRAIRGDDLERAVQIALSYYDAAYHHRSSRAPRPVVATFDAPEADLDGLALAAIQRVASREPVR